MKKSNTLILLAVMVITGCLIFYNFKLKAVYDSKSYKDPYNGMEFIPMSGVEKLNFRSGYNTEILIEQGDKEGVWIETRIKDKVKLSRNGDLLNVDLNGTKNKVNQGSIKVIGKKLSDLVVNHNEFESGDSYFQGKVNVRSYNLNKLNLHLSGNAIVRLQRVSIDTLTAVVGQKIGYSILDITNEAHVGIADYDIGVNGDLRLHGTKISTNNKN